MIPWKQRLYAFLLRRILGPILDASSTQKLHESIEVSFQEGKFVLKDVALNAAYITERLAARLLDSKFAVRRAQIGKLEINLSLQEHGVKELPQHNSNHTAASSSSLAWRAMQLGKTSATESRVSLVAHIEISDVTMEIESTEQSQPCETNDTQNRASSATTASVSNDELKETSAASTSSFLSSYVDAALSSLHLSLQINDLHIHLVATTGGTPTTNTETATSVDISQRKDHVLEIRLASAYYRDVPFTERTDSEGTKSKTMLNKALDVAGITVFAGERVGEATIAAAPLASRVLIVRTEGTGQVCLRAVEYSTPNNGKTATVGKIQQDLEFQLNQRVNIWLDESSLIHILAVSSVLHFSPPQIEDTASPSARKRHATKLAMDRIDENATTLQQSNDENADYFTMTGIVKQYQEAWLLAERHEVRGGILIPSHAFEDATDGIEHEGGVVTFDAFFDANDQSFHSYASKLRESILSADAINEGDDFIHTKVRFFLREIGVKFVFQRQQVEGAVPILPADEYILANLGDINVSGSVSRQTSSLSLSVAHVEVDDSQLVSDQLSSSPRADIGSILHFNQDSFEDDINNETEVVSQAPCLSLQFNLNRDHQSPDRIEIDVSIEPLELVYHERTVSNLISCMGRLKRPNSTVSETGGKMCIKEEGDDDAADLQFTGSCPSISVTLPLHFPVEVSDLYRRCGQELRAMPLSRAHLGFNFDEVLIELKTRSDDTAKEEDKNQLRKPSPVSIVSCHQMVVFVSSPAVSVLSVGTCMQRLDVLALSGRLEVDPVIPVALEFRSQGSGVGSLKLHAREAFPSAPSISSFKARQADEDEDEHIAEVLLSNLKDLEVDSRKGLRGSDPQIVMLDRAERCSAVVQVQIPEIWCDLRACELATVLRMLQAAQPTKRKPSEEAGDAVNHPGEGKNLLIGIALNLDQATFSIHDKLPELDKRNFPQPDQFSFCLTFDGLKAHAIFCGQHLQQARLLSHDFCLYDVTSLVDFTPAKQFYLTTCKDRVEELRKRFLRRPSWSAKPILFRSHLFSPLSPTSPSILIDLQCSEQSFFLEQSVHITLYHVTLRYDVDSSWLERLTHVLVSLIATQTKGIKNANTDFNESKETSTMTKIFLSMADCNVDYESSSQFKTASRTIVLISDVRLTSNMVNPAGAMQAFNVSVGDASVHVCNSRFTDPHELYGLPRSSILIRNGLLKAGRSIRRGSSAAPESVLRGLSFIHVLNLDSMEAVVIVSNAHRPVSEPKVTVSITFGTFCLYVCQDSFECLIGTISEWQSKLTALTDEQVSTLKSRNTLPKSETKIPEDAFFDAQSEEIGRRPSIDPSLSASMRGVHFSRPRSRTLDDIKKKSALGPTDVVQSIQNRLSNDFNLDGYDWTTVDHDSAHASNIPEGEEQVARWFMPPEQAMESGNAEKMGHSNAGWKRFRLDFHHFALQPVSNPLGEGDMGTAKFAGMPEPPPVNARILVHDLGVRVRFFDGYDWPLSLDPVRRKKRSDPVFIILEPVKNHNVDNTAVAEKGPHDKKSKFLDELLVEEEGKTPLYEDPLPRERAAKLEREAEIRRLSRRTSKFFQISASGVSLRLDTFVDSPMHQLASCIDLAVNDFFVAETVSDISIKKMVGEWVNEEEHPRDTSQGLVKLKMVTWHAASRVTPENKLASDECQVRVELLPLRCNVDQRAIRFAQAFFGGGKGDKETSPDWACGMHLVPPPLFQLFCVKRCKLKVDYNPEKIDVTALREGSYVELINLSPLDGMVLTLKKVELYGHVGLDSVIGELLRRWVQDICATQIHKFIINARPFEPVTNVGGGIFDLVVLPWESFKSGGSITRGIRSGLSSLAGAVAYETLTTSSRVTQFAADGMARVISSQEGPATPSISLPSRPMETPRSISDVTGHALESVARGVQAANYKVVIVPYREYRKSGPSGAAKSVLKGIPVAIMAPITGATEAISYTLLGARNQMRPDIRKEEEASHRGLHYDL